MQLIIKLYEIKNKIIIEGLTIWSEILYGSLKDQAHNDHYINNWNNQKKNIFQCLKVIFTFRYLLTLGNLSTKRPKSQTMRPTLKFSAIFVFFRIWAKYVETVSFFEIFDFEVDHFWPKMTKKHRICDSEPETYSCSFFLFN